MTKDEVLQMVIDNLELQDFNTVNATLIAYCKESLEQKNENKVTRLEIIDNDGRSYTNWKVNKIDFSYQDNGRTLKLFVYEK